MEIRIQDIRTLIEWLDASTVGELSLEHGQTRLLLKKTAGFAPVAVTLPAAAAAPEPVAASTVAEAAPEPAGVPEPTCFLQKAPMVGTFYAAPSPDAASYVQVGDRVAVGQILCIIEAMKLMNEIEAEQGGIIRAIRVKNAAPVEFGQPLFEIEAD